LESRFGAWVSPQSTVIESREWLEKKYEEFSRAHATGSINRPDHWGGYIVKPVVIEFWQGRSSRLHDRLEYSLQNDGTWRIVRLAP
jgi:pyridoxamine 5'-phosphate oxidase